MPTPSYRDLEAYRLARNLLADAYREEAASPRLGRAALTVALHVLDGARADDPEIRRHHLRASLAAAEELERLVERYEEQDRISPELASEMRELGRRTEVALLETLGS